MKRQLSQEEEKREKRNRPAASGLGEESKQTEFVEGGAFHFSTLAVKRLSAILSALKDTADCTLHFSESALRLFASYQQDSVYCELHLNRDFFGEVSCPVQVAGKFSLFSLARQLGTMQKFKCQTVEFNHGGKDLQITGYPNKGPVCKALLTPVEEPVQLLDTARYQYPVTIRVASQDLQKLVEGMPGTFTITCDTHQGALVFSGQEDSGRVEVAYPLDEQATEQARLHSCVGRFQGEFVKNSFALLGRVSKLAGYVSVSFRTGAPLMATATLVESMSAGPASYVTLYIARKFTQL